MKVGKLKLKRLLPLAHFFLFTFDHHARCLLFPLVVLVGRRKRTTGYTFLLSLFFWN